MSTAMEYERLKIGIVDFNLTRIDEPTVETQSSDSPCGFLAELDFGARTCKRHGIFR